jgi:hypothetical protein
MQRIFDPGDLSFSFERRVQWLAPNTMWRAHSDRPQLRFSVYHPVESRFRDPVALALAAQFLGSDVQICAVEIWEYDRTQRWRFDEGSDIPDVAAGIPTDVGGPFERCCRTSM